MGNFIKTAGSFVMAGTAIYAGYWLWDRFLLDKADALADKLEDKFKKKES